MIECQVQVRGNRHLGDGFFLIDLAAPEVVGQTRPGQFVMLSVGGSGTDPLLKRPFGILDAQGEILSLLYEVVGRGTQCLSMVSNGTMLDMVGPLGNGFPDFSNSTLYMIAGGRGFAPLFLCARLLSRNNRVFFRYGARGGPQLKLADWLEQIDLCGVELYTEDGSTGRAGRVNDELPARLRAVGAEATLSCGPDAMLKALADCLTDVPGVHYGSFEALMGCGIGICHSCALSMKDGGYLKVCSDGPVFRLEDVAWPD